MTVRRTAAIDCGTNSIRLLIADHAREASARDVVREMVIVRLGEGVDATGAFSQAALERTFAACRHYAGILDSHGSPPLRFVATSATRDAANRDVFVAGVREILGVTPEVISGAEEGELSFIGATSGLPTTAEHPFLVVDIGGGSTEFVLGSGAHVASRISVDIGCVRLTERHLAADPPTPGQVAATIADIDAAIARAGRTVDLPAARTLIGVAGSVTTVAAISMGLAAYDADAIHRSWLPAVEVARISAELLVMPRAQRAALPVMHPGRVDVIGAGALILARIVLATGAARVLVSEHDILDGVARSLVTRYDIARPIVLPEVRGRPSR